MAAGIIQTTTTTTSGETIEQSFLVDDTGTPTTYAVAHHAIKSDGTSDTSIATLNSSLSDGTQKTQLVDSGGTNIPFLGAGQASAAQSGPVVLANDKGIQTQHFAVAGATLTRPSDTTAYTALDSISDNGTAGSVTALTSNNLSDTNDYPISITHIILDTNDTAIGATGNGFRVYVYNSDPTANSGVQAGNNAAFSNKRAGLVGTFTGSAIVMSDGGKCVCVPESGAPFLTCKPVSGAKNLYYQIQATTTQSGSPTAGTTIIPTFVGFQGRP